MKILANDGISKAGEKALLDAGMELVEHKVSQEQLIHFINENNIEVIRTENREDHKTMIVKMDQLLFNQSKSK